MPQLSQQAWFTRYICYRYLQFISISMILRLDFRIVPTVWYFQNCSDSVVFLELFRQCGIFRIVPTVWYFQNCSDSVVFLELFRQCDIFGIVPTVWYFRIVPTGWYLRIVPTGWYFRIVPTVWYFQNCSDSVVFFEFSFQWYKWIIRSIIFYVFHYLFLYD